MKTENMKLLDLQTGKYLEFGRNFLYGGNYITLIELQKKYLFGTTPTQQQISPTHFPAYPSLQFTEIINKYKCNISEPQEPLKTLCEKTGAVVYGDRYVLLATKSGQVVEKYGFNTRGYRDLPEYCVNYQKTTILYITPESDLTEDIAVSTEIIKTYALDREYDSENEDRQDNDKRWYNHCGERTVKDVNEIEKEIVITDVFEEHSKQLRKEENKFDELMEKLK